MGTALIEGAGGLTTGGIIRHMQQAGLRVVCVDSAPHSAALYLADCGRVIPPAPPGVYLEAVREVCRQQGVAMAFPTVPATLLEWSRQSDRFAADGTTVVVSPPPTIAVCEDKWLFYEHFRDSGVPLPQTSLRGEFPLIKPRRGHGGSGVFLASQPVDMTGRISQEFLEGEEFSADVLCDFSGAILARCIRKRLRSVLGAAVAGETADHPEIAAIVDRICNELTFVGPVNLQFIQTTRGVFCTEVNPRLGGGAALSMAASTDNWFTALLAAGQGRPVETLHSRSGLYLTRHYAEVTAEAGRSGPRPPDAEQVCFARGARGLQTFSEALQSPCLSCPTSPCCRFLTLQRLALEDIQSVDFARYLLNFERIRLGLGRDGSWSVLYEQSCRFLDPSTALCRVHGTPAQPSICQNYNPHRCWYKPRLAGDGSDLYVTVDRPRMEFIISKLAFDDSGRIVDVPGWSQLQNAFREMMLESWPPLESPRAGEAENRIISLPPVAPADSSPESGASFRYTELSDPCRDCGAYCCATLIFPCQKPETMAGLDYLQYGLGFPGVEIGVGDNKWSILVNATCLQLREGRCALFGQKSRPLKCVYYDALRCNFKSRFGLPPPRDFVRISLERFPMLLEQFRFNRDRQVVSQPTAAALADAFAVARSDR